MKVLAGVPLFLDRHLASLRTSLAGVGIREPDGVAAAIAELLAATGAFTGSLYLQITRGAASVRGHRPPADLAPTLFLLPSPIDFPTPAAEAPGLAAISQPDPRWQRCDLKTTSLVGAVLGTLAAERAGADEVLFVGPDGELREGGHTNVFVRAADRLETPPLGPHVLPGVTRGLLLELAAAAGLEARERAPRLASRGGWQELLICGTLTGVRGVVRLDGAPVGAGTVGAWTRRLAAALEARERRAAAAGS